MIWCRDVVTKLGINKMLGYTIHNLFGQQRAIIIIKKDKFMVMHQSTNGSASISSQRILNNELLSLSLLDADIFFH